jgi:hypothetical protein
MHSKSIGGISLLFRDARADSSAAHAEPSRLISSLIAASFTGARIKSVRASMPAIEGERSHRANTGCTPQRRGLVVNADRTRLFDNASSVAGLRKFR